MRRTCCRPSVVRACQRSYLACMASQLSGVRPSAFDSRRAISGLTPLRPLSRRANVEAATFSFSDNSRPLTPCGSRYTPLINSPGCGGLCMLVIVFIIKYVCVTVFKFKRKSPVAINGNRPATSFRPTKGVQTKPRNVHIAYDGRSIQRRQLKAQSFCMRRLNAGSGATLVEFSQALVPERFNHRKIIPCCATRYGGGGVRIGLGYLTLGCPIPGGSGIRRRDKTFFRLGYRIELPAGHVVNPTISAAVPFDRVACRAIVS